MTNDTNFGINSVAAAPDVPVVQPVIAPAVSRAEATKFDRMSHASLSRPRSVGEQSSLSTRFDFRKFDAGADWFDPSMHVAPEAAHVSAPPLPTHTNNVSEADRIMQAALMQGGTLMQQTGGVNPPIDPYITRRRYSDIVAASEAAAIAALRTSPDDKSGQQGQQEQREERTLLPGIGLATRAAKKEWLRCVTSAPLPMRPTPHLPKLG